MHNSPTKKLQPRTPAQIIEEQKSAAARLKQENATRAAQQPRAVATRPAAPPAAMPPDDRSPIERYLDEIAPATFPGQLFKFDGKQGVFVLTSDGEPFDTDRDFVVLCDETLIGMIKFSNEEGVPPERVQDSYTAASSCPSALRLATPTSRSGRSDFPEHRPMFGCIKWRSCSRTAQRGTSTRLQQRIHRAPRCRQSAEALRPIEAQLRRRLPARAAQEWRLHEQKAGRRLRAYAGFCCDRPRAESLGRRSRWQRCRGHERFFAVLSSERAGANAGGLARTDKAALAAIANLERGTGDNPAYSNRLTITGPETERHFFC